MDFIEIIISVDIKDIEPAQDIANMVVTYGIYIEDYSNMENEVLEIANIDMIDEDLLNKDRTKGIIHIYMDPKDNLIEAISFLKEQYDFQKINYEITTKDCNKEDYINNWKQYFKDTKIGNKLLIRPMWEKDTNEKDRIVLKIEPGLAFGTGTHETTTICLCMLEKYIKNGMTVLDVGCGSGILSVASVLLGASFATGVDIDEIAVKTAKENAKINGVLDKFNAIQGNLTDKVSGKFNIVVANIVADAIIYLTSDIESYLDKDSIYITSGIIDTRKDEVLEVLSKKFNIIKQIEKNGWIGIAAKLKD